MEKILRGKPFRLVSIEAGTAKREEVLRLCRRQGLDCTVVPGGDYPARKSAGIPYAVVFDPAGHEIFQGPIASAKITAQKAVLSAPRLFLAGARIERLKTLAAQVESGSSLGQAASALRRRAAGTDPSERAEAEALLIVLERHAKARMEGIDYQRRRDPERSLAALRELAKDFSGDEIGARAAALAQRDTADPALQKLRKALKDLAAQERLLEDFPPCKAHKQGGEKRAQDACEGCRKSNAAALERIRKALSEIAERCPETSAAERARALAEAWSLTWTPP